MLDFTADEYERRIERTRVCLAGRGIDHLLVFDPASLCYLTGYSACSFYTPQALLLPASGEMTFFCREMDAPAARETTYAADPRDRGMAAAPAISACLLFDIGVPSTRWTRRA
jgi:Xaa-Pro aminopeptidase